LANGFNVICPASRHACLEANRLASFSIPVDVRRGSRVGRVHQSSSQVGTHRATHLDLGLGARQIGLARRHLEFRLVEGLRRGGLRPQQRLRPLKLGLGEVQSSLDPLHLSFLLLDGSVDGQHLGLKLVARAHVDRVSSARWSRRWTRSTAKCRGRAAEAAAAARSAAADHSGHAHHHHDAAAGTAVDPVCGIVLHAGFWHWLDSILALTGSPRCSAPCEARCPHRVPEARPHAALIGYRKPVLSKTVSANITAVLIEVCLQIESESDLGYLESGLWNLSPRPCREAPKQPYFPPIGLRGSITVRRLDSVPVGLMKIADENDELRHACFQLALSIRRLGAPVELNGTADEFYKIAIAEIGGSPNLDLALLARAVTYINRVHAIPLNADKISWFSHTLRALIEVARPNVLIDDDGRLCSTASI